MTGRKGGLLWWRARRSPGHQAAAQPAGGGTAAATPAGATAHERVVRYLVVATAAERATLQELYESSGIDRPVGLLPAPAPAADDTGVHPVGSPADLQARLFGSFEVRYQDQVVAPWSSQRAASLLKLLLLHRGRPVRREVLMNAFWPGSSAKSARNNLNVAVYQLRQQLRAHDPERTHIVYCAGSYRIDPGLDCWVDVDAYERSVTRGNQAASDGDWRTAVSRYRDARRLYAGPLLDDDTSGDWYVESQRRFHVEHCAVLEQLCALLLKQGETDEAVMVGHELLGSDPCRETGHRLLMCAYAVLGQPQLLVQQYRRCEATLRRELSVDLSDTTVDLYRALLAGR